MLPHPLDHTHKRVGLNTRVGVQQEQEFAPGIPGTQVVGLRETEIGGRMEVPDLRELTLQSQGRFVGRAVVNHDDFFGKFVPALEYRADRCAGQRASVSGYDNNREVNHPLARSCCASEKGIEGRHPGDT